MNTPLCRLRRLPPSLESLRDSEGGRSRRGGAALARVRWHEPRLCQRLGRFYQSLKCKRRLGPPFSLRAVDQAATIRPLTPASTLSDLSVLAV